MSNLMYNNLWLEAKTIASEAAVADAFLQNESPQHDKKIFHSAVSEIYYKYVMAANKLNECYDQIVHPQKRLLIRKLFDGCLGRIIEIKNDLVTADLSHFSYNDEILVKLGLNPDDVEIKVPRYILREQQSEVSYKKNFIDEVLHNLGFEEEEEQKKELTELEAILIIQIHERARQGRLRGQFMKEIRLLKEKGKPDGEGETEDLSVSSALMIQKMWRGFTTRRNIKKKKMEEMLLIGMMQPPPAPSEAIRKTEEVIHIRHETQEAYEQEFLKEQERLEKVIKDKKSAILMEDLADEIRHWFRECYDTSSKFPEFPSEEDGGSRLMFSRQGTESELSKSTALSSKDSKKSKEKEKEKDKGKKGKDDKSKEEEEFKGYKMSPSNFLQMITEANEQYDEVWKNKDETLNRIQKHGEEMIYTEKYTKIETETRIIVDDMMRGELDLLQIALDKDKSAGKGKKGKKGKKKKKGRGSKKGKKKKEKDLTPDRTTESLFEELVTNGIIKKYPEVAIDSFLGEKSYATYDLQNDTNFIQPCLGDIRQVIKEYCILPMSCKAVRQSAPLIKSVLIAGPKGSGKKMLVNAICTELGAVLFDLTPANIVGKYPGKTGLIMLIHLVNKVSKLLQPSIIFIDGAEKPFVKKVPKTDKTDPKRLKKDLPKLVKGLTAEDRIMLIGTSDNPWDGEVKLLNQTYQKCVLIPRPDYGSVFFLWRSQLRQYSGIGPYFDVSSIAKMSDGFTIGEILKVIKNVITTKRMLQLRIRPLTHLELILELSKHEPVYKEEDEAALQWWWKTTLGKKKIKSIEGDDDSKKSDDKKKSK